MDVTIRQLRAFIAVLDAGSFSEAAKAIHVSQAALSGLIRELEDRVGVRVLDRTTRKVSPTNVGDAFEPMARRVIANLDEALESLTNLKELKRGLVRIAAPEPLSCTLLPELIAAYNERHSGVQIRFEDVPIQQVFEGLHNGSADVGFGPTGVTAQEPVNVQTLVADPIWVALRPDDPLTRNEVVNWKDLRGYQLINYMPNLAINVLSTVPPRHHPGDLVPVHRVNTALSMLKVRRAAVVCPSMAEALVRGFGLKFLPLQQPTVKWKVGIFTRQNMSLSPAVESFLNFALGFARTWQPTASGHPRKREATRASSKPGSRT